MNEFLRKYGWSIVREFPQDGSARSYARVEKQGKTAILMQNAAQDMPGHSMDDFIRIAAWLNVSGLKAPEVYEVQGRFLLIEDFGDLSFKKAIEQGQDAARLYALAHEVLAVLSVTQCPLELPDYYQSAVHEKRRWIIDWYLPCVRPVQNVEDIAQQYLRIWEEIERGLPECPQGFLHIDFHAENLMLLPQEQGVKQCGILDFQGAMVGPKPYDLANLLEDMRRDVPDDIRQNILIKYDEDFRNWYRVLATQFHCRLMGQIIWWAREQGKSQYLQYLPRVQGYLAAGLADPVLAPLAAFFSEIGLDFNDIKDLNTGKLQ